MWPSGLPLLVLYIQRQGHPRETQVDPRDLFRTQWRPELLDLHYVATRAGERSNFKNFLRTHRIMVMHSNERGEYRPRTLVDRKLKRLAQCG